MTKSVIERVQRALRHLRVSAMIRRKRRHGRRTDLFSRMRRLTHSDRNVEGTRIIYRAATGSGDRLMRLVQTMPGPFHISLATYGLHDVVVTVDFVGPHASANADAWLAAGADGEVIERVDVADATRHLPRPMPPYPLTHFASRATQLVEETRGQLWE